MRAVGVVYSGSDLLGDMDVTLGTIPSGAAVPVLRYVLVSTAAGRVGFAAGSVRLKVRAVIRNAVRRGNGITLSTGVFCRVVEQLPSGSIAVGASSGCTTAVAYRGTGFGVPKGSKRSFTCLPVVRGSRPLAVSRCALGRVVHRAVFSVTMGRGGGLVANRLFRVGGGYLGMISLSKRHVSVHGVSLGGSCSSHGIMIPNGALDRIDGVLSKRISSRIDVCFAGGRVLFRFSRAVMISELVRKRCFEVSRVLSDSCRAGLGVGGGRFLSYVSHTALLMHRISGGPVVVGVASSSVRLHVSSTVNSVGRRVSVRGRNGSVVVNFGPGFLVSTLHIVSSRAIAVCLMGPGTPYFVHSSRRGCACLVLPMGVGRGRTEWSLKGVEGGKRRVCTTTSKV